MDVFNRRAKIKNILNNVTSAAPLPNSSQYITTNRAANMKYTLKVQMTQQHSDESEKEKLDDEDQWEDMNSQEDAGSPWSTGNLLSR